ncbi:MAG: tRNA (guanosine(46)-N7)-methyltransferase TrmB [Cyclobacteriaceae bacterium]
MRQKLRRFAENQSRENIIQPGKPIFDEIKGNWRSKVFRNENPVAIELACGDGEYSVGLAGEDPNTNYIGVDIKGDRLYKGSTMALENNLSNVAFLRAQIHNLDRYFAEDEVNEIWLTFPDPRPKDRDQKRRLTHPRFMNLYRQIAVSNSWFKFKTDNTPLFDYTLGLLKSAPYVSKLEYTHNLYQSELNKEHKGIQTKYEKIWSAKGEQIKYLKFQFL